MSIVGGIQRKKCKERKFIMDENKELTVDTQKEASTEEQTTEKEKTVTVGEMQRRLDKEKESHASQIEALREEFDKKLQEEREKANLSEKELKEREAKKRNDELEKLRQENKAYKEKERVNALRDGAKTALTEKGIAADDRTVELVLRNDEDTTLDAVESLADLLSDYKNQLAKDKPPRTSGGLGTASADTDMFSIMDKAKQTHF